MDEMTRYHEKREPEGVDVVDTADASLQLKVAEHKLPSCLLCAAVDCN